MKRADKELPAWPGSLRVINKQLWCCCRNAGIVVFYSELQQQRTIPAGDMKCVYDVAEMSNGEVIIAAGDNGLYHRCNGEYSYCCTSIFLLSITKQIMHTPKIA